MSAILDHLKWWAYAVGVAALGIAAYFIRKSGADAEKLNAAKADMKAASTIAEQRAAAQSSSDAELKRKTDKWTRP